MADQTYTVELEDHVTPGLDKISKGLDSSTKKTNKFDTILKQVDKDLAKINKKSDKSIVSKTKSKDFENLDKTLKILGPTTGKVAGKFGSLGGAIESSTKTMIGMGGAAGYVGVGLLGIGAAAGAAAGGIFAYFKWFSAIEDAHANFNKSLRTIHGNLGRFGDKEREVYASAERIHVALGKSTIDTANDIAQFVKVTGDIKFGEELAKVKAGMEGLGDAGKNVNGVFDAISKRKIFTVPLVQLQKALITLGVAKSKVGEVAQNIYYSRDAKQQLMLLTQNRSVIQGIQKDAAASVTPMERLKLQFQDTIAKAFGSQGPTPLGNLLDKITKWLETSDAQQKFNDLFTSISESLDKITPENMYAFTKSVEDSLGPLADLAKALGFIIDSFKLMWKYSPARLTMRLFSSEGGLKPVKGPIEYEDPFSKYDTKEQQSPLSYNQEQTAIPQQSNQPVPQQPQQKVIQTVTKSSKPIQPQQIVQPITNPVQPVQPATTAKTEIKAVEKAAQVVNETKNIKEFNFGEIKVTINGIINSKDLELSVSNIVNKTIKDAVLQV